MAAPTARMRLTVEILPLVAENAHGPYQAAALAAFKGRKFALPVQLDHTLEQVWVQIEERYKRNYLSPVQASSFTIKKLQDAYDCDLDLSDTVGSIFEGENDAQMRMVKVVPSFVNRDFSMPVTSNLRPGGAQKRIREINEGHTSKRRRLDEAQQELMDMDPIRDRPVASTESEHSGEEEGGRTNARKARGRERANRSHSSSSLVFVQGTQTGDQEFGTQIKEESPELGLPLSRTIPESPVHTFKRPTLPASKMSPAVRRRTRSPTKTPRRISAEIVRQQSMEREQEYQGGIGTVEAVDGDAQIELGSTPSPSPNREDAVVRESSKSSPERIEAAAAQRRASRIEPNATPTSPPYMRPSAKTPKTYGRPKKTPNNVQRDVSLLNHSRGRSTTPGSESDGQHQPRSTLSSRARSFQVSIPDEIESTPQEDSTLASRRNLGPEDGEVTEHVEDAEELLNGTPLRKRSAAAGPTKPGSLKKPAHRSYLLGNLGVSVSKAKQTPKRKRGRANSDAKSSTTSFSASTKSSKATQASPEARLGSESVRRRSGRRSSPKVVITVRSPAARSRTNSAAQDTLQASVAALATDSGPENNMDGSTESKEVANTLMPDLAPRQPSAPKRTPIPLPENVRNLNINGDQPSNVRATPVPLPRNVRNHTINGAQPSKVRATPTHDSETSQKSIQSSREAAAKSKPEKKSVIDRSAEALTKNVEASVCNTFSLPEQDDMHVVPEEKLSTPRISDSGHSGSSRRITEVGIPDNVKHMKGSSPKTWRTAYTLPGKASRNGRLSKSASVDSQSPAPSKRLSQPVKDVKGSLLKVKEELHPKVGEITAPNMTPASMNDNKEDAIVLSSGGSSSDDSDSDEGEAEDEEAQPTNMEKPTPPRHLPVGQQLTESTEKKHNGILKKLFPSGQEKMKSNYDYATKVFGPVPQRPTIDEELYSLVADDADSPYGSDANRQLAAEDLESHLQKASEADSPDPRENQPAEPHVAGKPARWNSESWGFGGINEGTNAEDEADEKLVPEPLSRSKSPPVSESEDLSESESEAEEASKSKSTSAVNSTRSSPEVSRRPARYLSHSPTPEKSSSEEESVTSRSRSRSRVESPKVGSDSADSESDNSSDDSSGSSSDAEGEEEDVEMADIDKAVLPAADADPPSSPPELPAEPVTVVPATQSSQLRAPKSSTSSQPLLRRPQSSRLPNVSTPIIPASQPGLSPTPTGSSQSISQLAASRRATYSKFPSIKQQLSVARANMASAQLNRRFDPRTSNLGKFAQKNGVKKGKVFDMSESSEEESSSESSSGEEEPKKSNGKKQRDGCSVA